MRRATAQVRRSTPVQIRDHVKVRKSRKGVGLGGQQDADRCVQLHNSSMPTKTRKDQVKNLAHSCMRASFLLLLRHSPQIALQTLSCHGVPLPPLALPAHSRA